MLVMVGGGVRRGGRRIGQAMVICHGAVGGAQGGLGLGGCSFLLSDVISYKSANATKDTGCTCGIAPKKSRRVGSGRMQCISSSTTPFIHIPRSATLRHKNSSLRDST